ncbi:unnamed protein product [Prorocentrum cordatum]|uniref:Uncharacterized protein n=1 Tax=Prorocentrum cordatum TaxID=2364126 RepID=A0ABN9VVD4_9DINO|nr:unnamed protein product [Polarella glacialis]
MAAGAAAVMVRGMPGGRSSKIYAACEQLVAALRVRPEVALRAEGAAAALSALRVCAAAEHELRRASGFLPGFGRLALRLGAFGDTGGGVVLLASVGRLPGAPAAPAGSPPLPVARRSDPGEVAGALARRLRAGGAGPVVLRAVGPAAADNLLRAVRAAQAELAAKGAALAVAPALGASLAFDRLDQNELQASVFWWTQPAAPLLVLPGR